MAKKNKNKPVDDAPVVNTPETTTVEPTPEVEPEIVIESTVDQWPEIVGEPTPEVEPEIVVEKPKRMRSISLKESFEKALEQTPFVLFQNGVQLVRWKPNVRIECFEDGFEMNGHKYSYSGIEFRHL